MSWFLVIVDVGGKVMGGKYYPLRPIITQGQVTLVHNTTQKAWGNSEEFDDS